MKARDAYGPFLLSKPLNKNPLWASGQAPVASELGDALPVRGARCAVAWQKTSCSWAGSALRAEWELGQRGAASYLLTVSRTTWCYRNSSTRCQAFACSCEASLLSVRVLSGCAGLPYGVQALGGGEGWMGRPLDVCIDALVARVQIFYLQGTVGGQGCWI